MSNEQIIEQLKSNGKVNLGWAYDPAARKRILAAVREEIPSAWMLRNNNFILIKE